MTEPFVPKLSRVLVSYTTKPVDYLDALAPEFTGRTGTKDPEKIAEQIAEKRQAFHDKACDTVYTSTLDRVYLRTISGGRVPSTDFMPLAAENRGPGKKKQSMALSIVTWLKRKFPDAWNFGICSEERPASSVMFIGFDVKRFLKLVGLECAMPAFGGCPAELGLWYGNSDHRDLEEALLPRDCAANLDWRTVIAAWRVGQSGEQLAKFDALFDGWTGPGRDVERDMLIVSSFAWWLRMIPAMPPATDSAEE